MIIIVLGMVEDVFMSVRLYAQSRTHSGAIRARLLSLLELRANGWMKSNATELYYSKKIHDLSIKEVSHTSVDCQKNVMLNLY